MEAKKQFLTFLIRCEVLACEVAEKAARDGGTLYELKIRDYEAEKVGGEIKLRAIERRIKSEIEIKKTGLMTFEVRQRPYNMNGREGISTVVIGIAN